MTAPARFPTIPPVWSSTRLEYVERSDGEDELHAVVEQETDCRWRFKVSDRYGYWRAGTRFTKDEAVAMASSLVTELKGKGGVW